MTLIANRWYLGARPRTLPASIVPVAIGTAVAANDHSVSWWRAGSAMVVALSLQIAVNYANDYSDGVRGTDAARVGPLRLVGSGLASARAVKTAAMLAFAIAAIVGAVLALSVNALLLLVGVAAIPAAWFYTGGKRPYGYMGLGELFVFIFFGLVATCGSQFVQSRELTGVGLVGAVCAGLLAVGLLLVNNLRDIDNDADSAKKTLVVRVGNKSGRLLYMASLSTPFVLVALTALFAGRPWMLVALLAAPLAVPPFKAMVEGNSGRSLIATLGATGRLQIAFGLLFSLGVVL